MVDFSWFFILFEYTKRFLSGFGLPDFAVYSHAYAAVIFCSFALFLILAIALKGKNAAQKFTAKGVFTVLSKASFFLFIVYLIWGYAPRVARFFESLLNITTRNFVVISIALPSGIIAIVCFFISRALDPTPNNNSELNRRQKFFVYTVIATAVMIGALAWGLANNVFNVLVVTIIITAELISLVFWFYDPFIYIISHLLPKGKNNSTPAIPPTPGKINRFAVIGCAHNEESVIGKLVESVLATSYPKNMYDIYVICDNCTDGTAAAVKRSGGIAMERQDQEKRGKGFGLEWMFANLTKWHKEGNCYDAYIVLDADNLVNEKYLDEVNEKLNEGNEILQTYLGCKNPGDTWVSKCYSMAYWLSNSNYQHAHSKVGLSAQMGGTGMVLRPSVLKEVGWKTDSLTEDLVLTANYTLKKNKPCIWVHNARLYDEKPLKLKPSIKQRTRWMQGHMKAMTDYAPSLMFSGIKNRSILQLDMAFYLARPFLNYCMFIIYLARVIGAVFMPESILAMGYIMNFHTATVLLLTYTLVQLYVLSEENYLRYFLWIPLQWIFTYSWYPAFFRGIVKRKELYWVSTAHHRNISIDEIREDILLVDARKRLEGLDNLHRLPLGQILLKAAVITGSQLDRALEIQKQNGGQLGDIILRMNVLLPDVLESYLSIQKAVKEAAVDKDDKTLQLGSILIAAGIITEDQLNDALNYQKIYGGILGECLIKTQCLTPKILDLFLSVQKIFDENYLSLDKSQQLIRGLVDNGSMNFGAVLYNGGMISRQQLSLALEKKQSEGIMIGEALIRLGFISERTLQAILQVQQISREFANQRKGPT